MTDEAFDTELDSLQDEIEAMVEGKDRVASICALGGAISLLATERALTLEETVEAHDLAEAFIQQFQQMNFWANYGGLGLLRFVGYVVTLFCQQVQGCPHKYELERLFLAGSVSWPKSGECGSMEGS